MPGLFGIVTGMPRPLAEAKLLAMLGEMRHESGFITGTWIDEALGLYLGWALRAGAGWTLKSDLAADGSALFRYGEEFSDRGNPSIRDCAGRADFAARWSGAFHGIHVDPQSRKVMLFNDRHGLRRIYYHESGEAFFFAAEAKAILKAVPTLRCVDPGSLGELVACGCVLANRSLFRGVDVLPPASAWEFSGGRLRKCKYFDPAEWEQQEPSDPEQYYGQLREIFATRLQQYFDGPERIAMSLTGGLDTRAIMAWRRPEPESLPCYTFGSMYNQNRDVTLAKHVAKLCRQQHHVIPVGNKFLADFPQLAQRTVYLSDGCVDVKHSADLYVNQIARGIAPVRMTGNYGDEILRRISVWGIHEAPTWLYSTEFQAHVTDAGARFQQFRRENQLSFVLFRQLPWHHHGLSCLEESQLATRTPFLDCELHKLAYRTPTAALAGNQTRERLISDGAPALARLRTDLGFGGPAGSPMAGLYQRLQLTTMKAEYAYDYGMPSWAASADSVLSKFGLPHLFLGRHKFYHYRIWYRDQLANHVREVLLDPQALARPYLRRNGVEQVVEGHLRGKANYTVHIHKLLTLELIQRQLVSVQ